MNDLKRKDLERNNLNLAEKLYLPEIAKGMFLVLKRMLQTPKMTRQYPEERWIPTGSYRGRPVLVVENGVERCVACGLCARVCPPIAITVQAAETPMNKEKERYPAVFEIDMLRCIYCGFCEEACPEEAIVMSKDYELVFQSQETGKLDKARLLITTEELSDRLEFVRDWK
jgi:NADH-quinone oxidoreductase subunit I